MVQVLPQAPSFGELLGGGLGSGIQQGVQQQQQSQQAVALQKEKYATLMDILNPSGGQSGDGQVNLTQSKPTPGQIQTPEQTQTSGQEEQGSLWSKLNPQKKMALSLVSPQFANAMETADYHSKKIQQEKEQKGKELDFQERKFAHESTANYAKNLEESTKEAQEVLHGVNYLDKALTTKTSNRARDLTYAYLKSRQSAYAALYQNEDAIAKELAAKSFSGGFRSLMGAKPTQNEFFWYESILPGVLKDIATNVKSRNYFKEGADLKIKAQEVYDQLVKQNKGWRPIDIDTKVREKMKPELDKYISKGQDLYKKSLEEKEKFSIGKTFNTLPKQAPDNTYIKDDKGNVYKREKGKWTAL